MGQGGRRAPDLEIHKSFIQSIFFDAVQAVTVACGSLLVGVGGNTEMRTKRGFGGLAAGMGLLLAAATASGDEAATRSGYFFIRMMRGEASIAFCWTGIFE